MRISGPNDEIRTHLTSMPATRALYIGALGAADRWGTARFRLGVQRPSGREGSRSGCIPN